MTVFIFKVFLVKTFFFKIVFKKITYLSVFEALSKITVKRILPTFISIFKNDFLVNLKSILKNQF